MKHLWILCLALILLTGCSSQDSLDLDTYTEYLGKDYQTVAEALGKEEAELIKTENQWWTSSKHFWYAGLNFDVRFRFDEGLKECSLEYLGYEDTDTQDAAMKIYKTLTEEYGETDAEHMGRWNAFWYSLSETESRGNDEYGYYKMVGVLWRENGCEYIIKLYEGEGRIRIQVRYF